MIQSRLIAWIAVLSTAASAGTNESDLRARDTVLEVSADSWGYSGAPSPGGIRISSAGGAWTWQLDLVELHRGSACTSVGRAKARRAEDGGFELDHGPLLQWYSPAPEGLLHGITVRQRPVSEDADSGLPLEFVFEIGGTPSIPQSTTQDAIQFLLPTASLRYSGLKAWDATGRVLDCSWVAGTSVLILRIEDVRARYPIVIDPVIYVQESKVQATVQGPSGPQADGAQSGQFGYSVALSGTTLGVGASGRNAAYMFERQTIPNTTWAWTQKIGAPAYASNFGWSIALDGNRLVVGAPDSTSGPGTSNTGRAFFYEYTGGTWSLVNNSSPIGTNGGDHFGRSCALEGTTAIVGAENANAGAPDAGEAQVFIHNGSSWVHQQTLTSPNFQLNGLFGHAVDIQGNTAVVSATREDIVGQSLQGIVYVYQRSGTTWTLQQTLLSPHAAHEFGYDLDLEGNRLLVGCPFSLGAGDAHVYRLSSGSWVYDSQLDPKNGSPGLDQFGFAVALSGDVAIVGSLSDALLEQRVQAFRDCGVAWCYDEDVFPIGYPNDPNLTYDRFGQALASSGTFLAVGSPGASDSTGTTSSGTAYVFNITTSYHTEPYCTPGTSTNGCSPTLSTSGTPSASSSSGFTVTASGVDGQKSGLFFYSITGPAAVIWAPGSTSFRCVANPTDRMNTQTSGGTSGACDGSFSQDWLAYMTGNPGSLGSPLYAGECFWMQCWYRDPPAPAETNLTDAIAFSLIP
jgi:hypothetical protein